MHILQVSRKCTGKYQYLFSNSAVVTPLLPPEKKGESGRTFRARSGKAKRVEAAARHSGPNENCDKSFFLISRCSPEHLAVETPGSVSPGF